MISRIPLPGGSLARMPLRSLVRAPRRTVLTLLALSGILAMLFCTIGMRDSLASTIEQGDAELLGDEPERLIVRLDSFRPIDSPAVSALVGGGALLDAEPGLSLAAEAQPVGPCSAPMEWSRPPRVAYSSSGSRRVTRATPPSMRTTMTRAPASMV